MNKKLILTIGTITSAIAPVAAVVACGTTSTSNDGKTQGTGNATSNTNNKKQTSQIETTDILKWGSDKYFDDGLYRSKRPINNYAYNYWAGMGSRWAAIFDNKSSKNYIYNWFFGFKKADDDALTYYSNKDYDLKDLYKDGYYNFMHGHTDDGKYNPLVWKMNFFKAYDMIVETGLNEISYSLPSEQRWYPSNKYDYYRDAIHHLVENPEYKK